MGSKTFDGVWFISFSHDHEPAHVHGRYGATQVIVDLLPDRSVAISKRKDAIEPRNAKRSDVRKVRKIAEAHAEALHELWEATHDKSAD